MNSLQSSEGGAPSIEKELDADLRALRRARRKARRDRQLHQGAMVIPSLFTFINMLCGFVAITMAINGAYYKAALVLFAGGLFDVIDGRLARLLGATSKFGVELDSLADLISFCLAPALIIYLWGLQSLGKPGIAVAFFYLMAGAGRLARFNIITAAADKRFFMGLPTPPSAGVLMGLVLAWPRYSDLAASPFIAADKLPLILVVLILALAFLMVSNVPFRTFKDLPFDKVHPLIWLMGLVGFLLLLILWPEPLLLGSSLLYVGLTALIALYRLLTGKPSPVKITAPPMIEDKP